MTPELTSFELLHSSHASAFTHSKQKISDVGSWLCSLGYFRFYVVFAFVILLIASVIGIVYPIWEARDLIAKFLTGNTFQELIEKSFHGSSRGGSR